MPKAKNSELATDGRAQRTLRSRKKIVDAAFELYSQGKLIPTAQQIADRSGLGIRTVFRHFSEMEALFTTANEILHQQYAEMPVVHPEGTLSKRIEQLVTTRSRLYEKFAPYIRATLVQKWRYKQADKQYQELYRRLNKEIHYFLPELTEKPAAIIDMLSLALSFEAWDRQRTIEGRSRKAIRLSMLASANSLMKQ